MKSLLQDPDGKWSATRLSALSSVAAALSFAFVHPAHTPSLASLLGFSALALGLRKKSPDMVSPPDNGKVGF